MDSNGTLRLPAPAKLNLMLRIVGRREDGYHLLQTVFQFIDRCDWIGFRHRNDGEIRLVNPLPGVPAESDLTVRAARLLRDFAGVGQGVDIEIEKNLPMGGGLGGGSSDAATTLVGLNLLWNTALNQDQLRVLGLRLGADVPIFVYGQSAWAEGVGEKLTSIDLPEPWYVVVVPRCHVATGVVFSSPELTRNNKEIKLGDFLAGSKVNHCLPVVEKSYPAVREALQDLSVFSEARLTGTGACVFSEFSDKAEAEFVMKSLSSKWLVFTAKGMNRSALNLAIS